MPKYFKKKSIHWSLSFFFLFTVLLSYFNIKKTIHCGQESGCIDFYWANFWLISYSDGYQRRALLGEVVQLFYTDIIPYAALNGILFSIIGLLLIGLYTFFFRKTNQQPHQPYLLNPMFFLVLISGPSTTIFFETLGDPLHVSLLIFIIGVFFLLKIHQYHYDGIISCVLALLLLLIHEASLFLIIPSLYIIHSIKRNKPIHGLFLFTVITITLLLIVFLFDNQTPNKSSLGLETTSQIYHLKQNALPNFWFLFKKEILFYFGSKEGLTVFLFKLVSPFFWPLFVLLSFSHALKQPRLLFIFIFLWIFSLPLYVIAHDWGRFSTYTFWLALFVWSLFEWRHKSIHLFPKFTRWLGLCLYRKTKTLFQSPYLLFLPVIGFYAYPDYRIYGLSRQNAILVLFGIGLLLLFKIIKEKRSPK